MRLLPTAVTLGLAVSLAAIASAAGDKITIKHALDNIELTAKQRWQTNKILSQRSEIQKQYHDANAPTSAQQLAFNTSRTEYALASIRGVLRPEQWKAFLAQPLMTDPKIIEASLADAVPPLPEPTEKPEPVIEDTDPVVVGAPISTSPGVLAGTTVVVVVKSHHKVKAAHKVHHVHEKVAHVRKVHTVHHATPKPYRPAAPVAPHRPVRR